MLWYRWKTSRKLLCLYGIWMNVVLAKIVAWLYHYEFVIMNMSFEIFITMKMMYFSCRKDCVQSPTSKEGWDSFWRKSDNSSRNNPKWRKVWRDFKRPKKHSSYVTLLSEIIDVESSIYEEVAKNKGKESTSSRRMMSRMRYWELKGSS